MEHFDYREATTICLKMALKELAEAVTLYEQQQYLLSEKKIASASYRTTSALRLISLDKEQDYAAKEYVYNSHTASDAAG